MLSHPQNLFSELEELRTLKKRRLTNDGLAQPVARRPIDSSRLLPVALTDAIETLEASKPTESGDRTTVNHERDVEAEQLLYSAFQDFFSGDRAEISFPAELKTILNA